MGYGLRTIRVVTTDTLLLNQTRQAAEALGGWEVAGVESIEDLFDSPPVQGDVLLLDKFLRGENVYEICRKLTGNTKCRTFLVAEHDNTTGDAVARFCGATGVLHTPLSVSRLRDALSDCSGPRAPLPADSREEERGEAVLPENLLIGIADGSPNNSLVAALTDPDTSLFNYAFLNFKLDEEFKRAQRFKEPLSCVMLGFDGQCSPEVLRQLSSIILDSSRDTDVLGRFDESSFLFLLPRTGPDGAEVMATRVGEMAHKQELKDLIGDELVISVGISCCPHPEVRRREDLYGRAREAFLEASRDGGGVANRC
ncbi:MAG: diguanylate cyclase (GGDEF)-like protein [Planctomycetota bacterium]|jgi:diguanylate cyclase (GGDEF)-like protein